MCECEISKQGGVIVILLRYDHQPGRYPLWRGVRVTHWEGSQVPPPLLVRQDDGRRLVVDAPRQANFAS
jgi:hypothetical protein